MGLFFTQKFDLVICSLVEIGDGRREMGSSRRVASHDYVEGIGSLLLVAPAQVGGAWEGWWSGGGGV